MKKIKIILVLLSVITLTFIACEEITNGIDVDPRDKFLGSWSANETCYKGNFQVTISKDISNSAQIVLSNFADPGPGYDPAIGIVADNKVVIASQIIGEDWTVSGTGTYENGTIHWVYTLVIAGTSESCTAEYTK